MDTGVVVKSEPLADTDRYHQNSWLNDAGACSYNGISDTKASTAARLPTERMAAGGRLATGMSSGRVSSLEMAAVGISQSNMTSLKMAAAGRSAREMPVSTRSPNGLSATGKAVSRMHFPGRAGNGIMGVNTPTSASANLSAYDGDLFRGEADLTDSSPLFMAPPFILDTVLQEDVDVQAVVQDFKATLEKFGVSQRFASKYIMNDTSQGNLSFLLEKGRNKIWADLSPRGRVPYARMKAWLDSKEQQLQTLEMMKNSKAYRKPGPKEAWIRREKFSPFQLKVLCRLFEETPNPSIGTRTALANKLNIHIERINVWFQNQRARGFPAKRILGQTLSDGTTPELPTSYSENKNIAPGNYDDASCDSPENSGSSALKQSPFWGLPVPTSFPGDPNGFSSRFFNPSMLSMTSQQGSHNVSRYSAPSDYSCTNGSARLPLQTPVTEDSGRSLGVGMCPYPPYQAILNSSQTFNELHSARRPPRSTDGKTSDLPSSSSRPDAMPETQDNLQRPDLLHVTVKQEPINDETSSDFSNQSSQQNPSVHRSSSHSANTEINIGTGKRKLSENSENGNQTPTPELIDEDKERQKAKRPRKVNVPFYCFLRGPSDEQRVVNSKRTGQVAGAGSSSSSFTALEELEKFANTLSPSSSRSPSTASAPVRVSQPLKPNRKQFSLDSMLHNVTKSSENKGNTAVSLTDKEKMFVAIVCLKHIGAASATFTEPDLD